MSSFGDFQVLRRSAVTDREFIEFIRGDGPARPTHLGLARSDGRVTYHSVDGLEPWRFVDAEGVDPSVHSIMFEAG